MPNCELVTPEVYKKRKQTLYAKTITIFVGCFLLCAVFFGFMAMLVSTTKPFSDLAGAIVCLIFFLPVLALFLVSAWFGLSKIVKCVQKVRRLHRLYLIDTPKDELARIRKKRNRRILLFTVIVCAVLSAVIVLWVIDDRQRAQTYEKAEALIADEAFEEAEEVLKTLQPDYKDTESLLALCKAHRLYANNDIEYAFYVIDHVRFFHQSEEQMRKINTFTDMLHREYGYYLAEEERLEKRKFEERIKNGVPFVGMPESRIGDTTLGKPSDTVRHNTENIDGRIYETNLYDFLQNGKIVFSARCVRGKVINVFDYRSNPLTPTDPEELARLIAKTLYPSEKEVKEFYHPEDFYEWYYDDFYDYEEAEAYYYSHGGR